MIATVDIGNTNVTVGFFADSHLLGVFKVLTSGWGEPAKVETLIKDKARPFLKKEACKEVYACSVVPQANKHLRSICRSIFKTDCRIAGEDFCVPLMNKYRIPSQVGQDRLVNAYAALKLHGKGLIVVDFGTAITFDVVSRDAEYLGGLIAPGLKLMQESLNKKTALLPFVELARPIELIGRDTASSIRAGIVFGAASLCDGIIERLLKKECRGYKIIVTGGDALLIKPHSRYLRVIEEDLILKGLAMIAASQKISKR